MMPSTIMVNPIQYVGLWNWRTKNCQIRQNLNSPTQAGAMRFRHTDVSVATDKELPRCDSWGRLEARPLRSQHPTRSRGGGAVDIPRDRIPQPPAGLHTDGPMGAAMLTI